MTKQITFIHTADLHLGASFIGLSSASAQMGQRLTSATIDAYNNVIEACLDNQVDFLIIAGDSFDKGRAFYKEYRVFVEGIQRLEKASIPVYLVTGNHDPFVQWQREIGALPANAHVFSAYGPDAVLFKNQGGRGDPLAIITGRSWLKQTEREDISNGLTRVHATDLLIEKSLLSSGEHVPFCIGVLHTGLGLDPEYAPAPAEQFRQAGVDYWALGHIHRPSISGTPPLVYAGSPQGLDINETGTHSCALVTLEEGRQPHILHIPTATVLWDRLRIDVSACDTLLEVQRFINDEALSKTLACASATGASALCLRITLVGRTPLHKELGEDAYLEYVKEGIHTAYPDVFVDRIVNRTSSQIDKAALRVEGLFPATLIDQIDCLQEDTAEVEALVAEQVRKRGLLVDIHAIDYSMLIEHAGDECLDLLMGGVS